MNALKRYLWSISKLKLGLNQNINSLAEEAKEIRYVFKSKNRVSVLAKSVFAGVVWHIWKERNRRIKMQRFKLLAVDTIILIATTWDIS